MGGSDSNTAVAVGEANPVSGAWQRSGPSDLFGQCRLLGSTNERGRQIRAPERPLEFAVLRLVVRDTHAIVIVFLIIFPFDSSHTTHEKALLARVAARFISGLRSNHRVLEFIWIWITPIM